MFQFNIILPSDPRSSKLSLSFEFPTKTLYSFLFYILRAKRPTYLFRRHLITRIMFVEKYKL